MTELRGELAWLFRYPIVASRWWFRHLVVQRLNGEHRAARRYEKRMGFDSYEDWYENAEAVCPYDGEPLFAPWEKCPVCGRSD